MEHKKCPYCAEMIKAEAIVCRYCQRPMPGYEQAVPPPVPNDRGATEPRQMPSRRQAHHHVGDSVPPGEQPAHNPVAEEVRGTKRREAAVLLLLWVVIVGAIVFAVRWHAVSSTANSAEAVDINEAVQVYGYDPASGMRVADIGIWANDSWVANLQHGDAVTLLRYDGINCLIRTTTGEEGLLDCKLLNSAMPVANATPAFDAPIRRFGTLEPGQGASQTGDATPRPNTPEGLAAALVVALTERRCDDVSALIRPDYRENIMGSGYACGPEAVFPLISSRIDSTTARRDPYFEGEYIVSVIGQFEQQSSLTKEIDRMRDCRVYVEQLRGRWYVWDWDCGTWEDSPPFPSPVVTESAFTPR